MEQAKKRDRKILITDVAIQKVDNITVPFYSDSQNKKIYEVHKELLKISKDENDSNEVAFLINMTSFEGTHQLGEEKLVNIFDNPFASAMANHSKEKELFLAHNHPTTKDFSYSDVGVFLYNDCIGAMSVVTNTGEVHILYKTAKYSFESAYDYLKNIRSQFGEYDEYVDREIVKEFLKNASKIGIKEY